MIAFNRFSAASLLCLAAATAIAATPPLLNDPVDISGDFHAMENYYYLADRVAKFDPATHSGQITYQRSQYAVRHAFDNDLAGTTPAKPNEFPDNQYAANPTLPFSIEFVSPRTLRIRMASGPQVYPPQPELMLVGPVPTDDSWKYEKVAGGWRYASAFGSVAIQENPFHIEIRDANGLLFLPGETEARELTLTKSGGAFKLAADPLAGRVTWKISVKCAGTQKH